MDAQADLLYMCATVAGLVLALIAYFTVLFPLRQLINKRREFMAQHQAFIADLAEGTGLGADSVKRSWESLAKHADKLPELVKWANDFEEQKKRVYDPMDRLDQAVTEVEKEREIENLAYLCLDSDLRLWRDAALVICPPEALGSARAALSDFLPDRPRELVIGYGEPDSTRLIARIRERFDAAVRRPVLQALVAAESPRVREWLGVCERKLVAIVGSWQGLVLGEPIR